MLIQVNELVDINETIVQKDTRYDFLDCIVKFKRTITNKQIYMVYQNRMQKIKGGIDVIFVTEKNNPEYFL